jgi:hypothetical protein
MENWRAEFGAARPRRISIVKTASSGIGLRHKERESKIFFLVFAQGSSRPFAVAKIPRFREAAAGLHREHRMLSALAGDARLGSAFLSSVPMPLYFGPIGPETAAVQSALNGCIFRSESKPGARVDKKLANLTGLAQSWLDALRPFAACGPTVLSDEQIISWFIQPLDVMSRAASQADCDAGSLFHDIMHEADALAGVSLGLVRQHGDFTASNVSFARGECRVLDFEHYGIEQNPLFDILWFARSLWYGPYGPAWSSAPAAAQTLRHAAQQALGDKAMVAARALYTQALLKSFSRKYMYHGADSEAARALAPGYLAELEALRGSFAA